jgi:(p)ppGpp synthase/HD superfamily hydrolase
MTYHVPLFLTSAYKFATKCHGDQMYGDKPYICHLIDVINVMIEFNIHDRDLLRAGLLHDVIEDTQATYFDLYGFFGERVASLVDAVSDGPGDTREERKARPYKLIPLVPGAVLIKASDRLANVRHASSTKNTKILEMYRQEHPLFEKKLRGSRDAEPLFQCLCKLLT